MAGAGRGGTRFPSPADVLFTTNRGTRGAPPPTSATPCGFCGACRPSDFLPIRRRRPFPRSTPPPPPPPPGPPLGPPPAPPPAAPATDSSVIKIKRAVINPYGGGCGADQFGGAAVHHVRRAVMVLIAVGGGPLRRWPVPSARRPPGACLQPARWNRAAANKICMDIPSLGGIGYSGAVKFPDMLRQHPGQCSSRHTEMTDK